MDAVPQMVLHLSAAKHIAAFCRLCLSDVSLQTVICPRGRCTDAGQLLRIRIRPTIILGAPDRNIARRDQRKPEMPVKRALLRSMPIFVIILAEPLRVVFKMSLIVSAPSCLIRSYAAPEHPESFEIT